MAIPHFTSIISVNDLMQFQLIVFAKSAKCLKEYYTTTWVQENEYYAVKPKLKEYVEVKPYRPDPALPWPWACCPRWDIEPRGNVIVGMDADVAVFSCEKVQQYVDLCDKEQCIMGTIAYHNPLDNDQWQRLAAGVGIKLKFNHQTNYCRKEITDCPYYINNGVVMMPVSMLQDFRKHLREMLHYVNRYYSDYYFPQVAVTLAVERMKIRKMVMPLEFNCIEFCTQRHTQENSAFIHYHFDLTKPLDIHNIKNDLVREKFLSVFRGKTFI
jgi:hypothetical protein